MEEEIEETSRQAHKSAKRQRSFHHPDSEPKRLRNEAPAEDSRTEGLEAAASPADISDPESGQSSIAESKSMLSCSVDGSFTTNTSLSTPPSFSSRATHDDSRSGFHIKDIATFAATLEEAAKGAFPNRGRSRYTTVNVCLIHWEATSDVEYLGFEAELRSLCDVFERGYGFRVEIWKIPIVKSHRKLMGMALDFIDEFDGRDNLFIVYYAGHGTINENRQSVWTQSREPKSPSVDWSSIQSLFENTSSDTLFLLDCCAAASSANNSGSGTIETIGACGFNGKAPPPGRYSFTNTLVEVLEDWKAKPFFPVCLLHSEMLQQLKRKRPEKGREGTRLEWCTTPVYYIASPDPRPQSIEMCRLHQSDPNLIADPSTQISNDDASLEMLREEQRNELTNAHPGGNLKHPHVLLSVALEQDQNNLHPEQFHRWLSRIPAFVKYVKVEGCFKSYSTLVLISLPVAIWNLLPNDPACCFIGYVTSRNFAFVENPAFNIMESKDFVAPGREIYPNMEIHVQRNDLLDRWCINQDDHSEFCAHQNPTHTDKSNYVPGSDSGYGSLRGFCNASSYSHDSGTPSYGDDATQATTLYAEEATAPENRPISAIICPTCHETVNTNSHLRKHDLRHRKPFRCEVHDCPRTEGFSTMKDLERHKMYKHPYESIDHPIKLYRCTVVGCKFGDRAVLRLDNFCRHLKLQHPDALRDNSLDEFVRRGGSWDRGHQTDTDNGRFLHTQAVKQDNTETFPADNTVTRIMAPPSLQPLEYPTVIKGQEGEDARDSAH